jgi:endonuclease/exonuclease/phosphatase (EEP) superfamily protein YafD
MEAEINDSTQFSKRKPAVEIGGLFIALTHFHFVVVIAWIALNLLCGDRWWWLFLLNSLSEYLFFLLPLPVAVALTTRRREIVVGLAGVVLVGVFLYGGLFLPSLDLDPVSGPQITVMTSNVLGYNSHPEGVISSIRASDADVVALQELNPEIAEAIRHELYDEYPYQELTPAVGVSGLGVISRRPLESTGVELEGHWVGEPQILEMRWKNTMITVVNFHAIPPGSSNPEHLRYSIQERERQVGELMAFVESRREPLILLGDLNVTSQNEAYRMMAGSLQDAWVEAGWGLGHTFPGALSPGSSRPIVAGIAMPKWLVRLDYVFCSDHWQVDSASFGQWDGVSDHRPVVARMVLIR